MIKHGYLFCGLIALLLSISSLTEAAVNPLERPFLHGIFTDNMVLQRDMVFPVWGWTTPGEKVTVAVAGKSGSAVADPDGRWEVKLGPFPAGGPHKLTVTGPSSKELKNVLFGDVWLCSGQSNMEFGIMGANQWWNELSDADYPNIRICVIPLNGTTKPVKNVATKWRVCSSRELQAKIPTSGGFSAIAFMFGREVYKKTKVPIGLIESCWGATDIAAWSKLTSLKQVPEGKDLIPQQYVEQKLDKSWQKMDPNFEQTRTWSGANFDDKNWTEIELPQKFQDSNSPVKGFSGVLWLRKKIELPADWAKQDLALELGPVDGDHTVWFNGQFIDINNFTKDPRYCLLPKEFVKPGDNRIAIRLLGKWGFTGKKDQLNITRLNGQKLEKRSIAGSWKYALSTERNKLPGRQYQRRATPTGCFNAMIQPLAPFAMKGALWYQGEGDIGKTRPYEKKLTMLIAEWRRLFNKNLGFYIVQLSGFGPYEVDANKHGGWTTIREMQLHVSQTIPHTGLAVSIDRGEVYDIHPPNKRDVAVRLAQAALVKTYGQNIPYSGPIYKSMKVEGDKIRLYFDHIDQGIVSLGGVPVGFSIAGKDKVFAWANAEIQPDNSIVVSSPTVKEPVSVRYGWSQNSPCNVYNKAGFPASPFRTDTW